MRQVRQVGKVRQAGGVKEARQVRGEGEGGVW